MNNALLEKTNVNQWKYGANLIEWFKSISNKKASSFVDFDVQSFYPSISQKLLTDAINYAKLLADMTEE